jgi:hypothetical protein
MATVEQIIGAEMKSRREARGITQDAVATEAQKYGLRWHRDTVAAIELGRRGLSLGEVALLPLVLADSGVTSHQVVSIPDLLPEDSHQSAEVSSGLTLSLKFIRELLGRRSNEPPSAAPKRPAPTIQEVERQAARKLGVTPEAIDAAARQLWDKGFVAQRELRVAVRTGELTREDPQRLVAPDWPRRVQAIRGAVARQLLRDLKPHLKRSVSRRRK